jgi:hypothetical protein
LLSGKRGARHARGAKRSHKKKTKTFSLAPVHASVKAGVPATLKLTLPKAALKALKRKARESVALTLTASNPNGTSTAQASIAQLHGVKARKRHR